MSLPSTDQISIARRYCQALIQAAEDAKAVPAVTKDMASFQKGFEGSDQLSEFAASPLYGREEQLNVMDGLLAKAKYNKLTANFARLLAENGRLAILPAIFYVWNEMMAEREGILKARVETAQPLNPTQQKDIEATLTKAADGRSVQITTSVNPDLIGGMTVKVGSLLIDDSVKRRLARLHTSMHQDNASLQNSTATND